MKYAVTHEDLLRLAYEAPMTVMCGPVWSALMAGYAVPIGGVLHLTPAGQRYLAQSFIAMVATEDEERAYEANRTQEHLCHHKRLDAA